MNVASLLPQFAKDTPDKVAVLAPYKNIFGKLRYNDLTFKELEMRSNHLAHYLLESGLKEGDRILVFVKPCTHFSVITFALFRAGLIPVFLDPGMGRKNLLNAIKQIKPTGLIGETIISVAKFTYPKAFKTVTHHINVNRIKKMSFGHQKKLLMQEVKPSDPAAILFTSGGTGIPKGVLYTHHIFNTQRSMLKEMFKLSENDIDLPGFPLFGLFTITMGMTSVLPLMNPSKPSKANPKDLVQNITDHQATFIAGSPAIWKNLAKYCIKKNITLPSVKYLVMFGAPVPIKLHKKLQKIIPCGDTYTPYGATECLPVTCISGKELVKHKSKKMITGFGTCIGRPCPGVTVKIMNITDNVIENDKNVIWLDDQQMGEICVSSETVTPLYVDMAKKTKEAKIIKSTDNTLWHRMGDLGYKDQDGHIWFCGRKTHRLDFGKGKPVLAPIPYENMINEIAGISRCALVGSYKDGILNPLLVVVPDKKLNQQSRLNLSKKIYEMIKSHSTPITISKIIYKDLLPVDGRHNIKIDRIKLAKEFEGLL